MRLFVAIELSEEVCAEVRRRAANLRPQLPRSRWVDPGRAHLTLSFLGEVEPARLGPLDAALAAACARWSPFTLRLHGGGTFPPGRPGRVAWVGVKAPPELFALQRDVSQAVAAVLAGEPERRPFHAHVTLARCRAPWPRSATERFHHEAQGPWGAPFEVREGVLFESRLQPRGPFYEALSRHPLKGVRG